MKPDTLTRLRSQRFWAATGASTFSAIGFCAVLLGLYNIVNPNILSKSGLPIPALVVLGSLIYGVCRAWPRPVIEYYLSPSTAIEIVVGDLFDLDVNLVIGMTDTFDTEVPHIIRRESIQGQFLTRIYNQDVDAFNKDLANALSRESVISTVQKPGNTARYSVGTVATIRRGRQHFFCVAYTSMDEHNQARGTIDGLWKSLLQLWLEAGRRVNGEAIAIPVIGGGQSRMSHVLPASDAIRFIALSFILASRQAKVCDLLKIVISPKDSMRIDMLEIQSFLASLKIS